MVGGISLIWAIPNKFKCKIIWPDCYRQPSIYALLECNVSGLFLGCQRRRAALARFPFPAEYLIN